MCVCISVLGKSLRLTVEFQCSERANLKIKWGLET